jgi:myo-inositol-1(or 4)-monophosphatase
MGIVYEVNRDEMFHALKGEGAFCNDERISVSSVKSLDGSLLATGFPYYEFSQMEKYLRILNEFMQKTHGIRRVGSAAVDLAYTACGRFEGFFEYNLNAWDVAAGIVLVQEAGGIITDFSNGPDFVFGRELIAGAPGVQQEMQKIIFDIWNA